MKIENTSESSIDAVAHVIGITQRQVQRLAASGIIPRAAHGRYNLPACVQAWGAYIAHGKATAELGSERRRLIAAQAHRVENENRRLDGELLVTSDVQIVLSEAMTIIAAGMDSLPGRLAGELAGITDPAIIRHQLLAETRRIRAAAADKLDALSVSGGAPTRKATGRRKR